MAFALSSTEVSFSCLGNVSYCKNLASIVPKGGNFTRLAGSKGASHGGVVKKAFISSHSVSGRHLDGLIGGKKQQNASSLNTGFVRTLLVDNYDSYTYNVYQELSVVNGMPPVVIRNDEWSWEEAYHYIYEERAFDNIVISPGPGSPTCAADIGICLRLLLECGDIPILGVCLGHQALGFAHGAKVVHAPEPIHGRLSEVEHDNSGLFHGIPSGENSGFKVVRYHSLVVDPNSLPRELIPIAWSSAYDTSPLFGSENLNSYTDGYERHIAPKIVREFLSDKSENGSQWGDKILMGIMHTSRPHYGLQFHPESIATRYGRQLFKNFADITKDYWSRTRLPLNGFSAADYAAFMQMQPNADADASSNKSSYPEDSKDRKFLKLKWRKVDCSLSQVGGSENIFSELFGKQDAKNTFWLDSSSTDNRARFSFMGGKVGPLWRQLTYRLSSNSDDGLGNLSIEDSEGLVTSNCLKDGFLDFLNKELGSFRYDATDYEGLPFDFYGGYIGYIGYDLKVECGASSNLHKSSTPDACFFFADNLVVIDHDCDDIYVLSIHDKSDSKTSSWLDETEQKLVCMKSSPPRKSVSQTSVETSEGVGGFSAEKSRGEYMKDVKKCQEFIKDGESYELCLTAQMTRKVGEINPLELYRDLRKKNPAPYAAWLNFAKQNLCICSSSPERFLRLDRNGVLEAKPIKGTISRGLSPEEDEARRLQLQHSEKDQAENLMIVDLLRNDLGRVCQPGSVHVPRLMEIESYATVHTMVSTIQGQKQPNASAVDCVRAAFPGGSMTGAPKLRSMEILDSIESSSRGVYSGCIGYISYNQTFDLNIVIRTVVLHEGEASIGAGGAITALSNPKGEYEEMVLKTKAPAKAVIEHVNMKRSTSFA